jgi:hypothetical protein
MIIRRATEVQIRAALDVANEQFGGNLRFQELEDLQAPRTPKFKVRLIVNDLEGAGCRRAYRSYYYGHTHKPRRTRRVHGGAAGEGAGGDHPGRSPGL